jgi:Leucine-rich repeat (LRR) protein
MIKWIFLTLFLITWNCLGSKYTIKAGLNDRISQYTFRDCIEIADQSSIECLTPILEPLTFPIEHIFNFEASKPIRMKISNKKFNFLPDKILRGGNFMFLDLSNNSIEKVSLNAFGLIIFMETLDLSRNKISNLLFLSSNLNKQTNLCSSFAAYDNLIELNLSSNQIEFLDKHSFWCLNSLQRLFLRRNYLKTIDLSDLDRLTRLDMLILDSNEIEQLVNQNNYSKMVRLAVLSLNFNRIKYIEALAFNGLKNLTELNLLLNLYLNLKTSIFNNLRSLKLLRISSLNQTELNEQSFVGLVSLSELRLERARISTITNGTFLPLLNLKALYLDNNDITQLSRNVFDGLINLEVLSLTGNPLQNIEANAFTGLLSIKVITLKASYLKKEDYCALVSSFTVDYKQRLVRTIIGVNYFNSIYLQVKDLFDCEMTIYFLTKLLHLNLYREDEFNTMVDNCNLQAKRPDSQRPFSC